MVDVTPDHTVDITSDDLLGINNNNEVAGTMIVGGDRHAFVWLPAPNHGLSAGLIDLHDAGDDTSRAHAISDNGYVVGQADGVAFAWKLGATITPRPSTTFRGQSSWARWRSPGELPRGLRRVNSRQGFAASYTTLAAIGSSASGGVVEFDDRDTWFAAVGDVITVDFVGFDHGTFITGQYAHLGVNFVDGNDSIFLNDVFLNDGAGLDGNGDITLTFDKPQFWIGADFPGALRIELFLEGALIYSSGIFGIGGKGFFAGLLSSEPFDAAIVMDQAGEAAIDDLHFGTIPAPGALWLIGLGAARLSPRRRHVA